MTADVILAWGVQTALAGGVLVLLVWAVERAIRGVVAPGVRLVLWSLVLLRFAIPGPLEVSGASIPWHDLPGWPQARSVEMARVDPELVPARVAAVSQAVRASSAPQGIASTMAAESLRLTDSAQVLESEASPAPSRPWLLSLWAIGVLVAMARLAIAERRFRRDVVGQSTPAPPWLQQEAQTLARSVGLRRAARVHVLATDTGASMLHGLVRPKLLVPRQALTASAAERSAMLLHELAHQRRHDGLRLFTIAALRSLWWFHPLVHLAAHRWLHALELSRDGDAMTAMKNERPRVAYAQALLVAAERDTRMNRAAPLALGWFGPRTEIEERIRTAAKPTRSGFAYRGVGVATILIIAWVTLTGALSESASAAASGAQAETVQDGADAARITGVPLTVTSRKSEESRLRLERLLHERVDELNLERGIESIAQTLHLNAILSPGVDARTPRIRLSDVTGVEALDLVVTGMTGQAWWNDGGIIRFEHRPDAMPAPVIRVYDVDAILRDAPDRERQAVALRFAVRNTLSALFPGTHAKADWTADRLHVEATHAEHRAVEQLLNGILNPLPMDPLPRSAAEDALAATYGERVALGSLSVGSWIEELEARTNLPVVIVGGTQEDLAARVELDFEGVPTLRQIAERVAQALGRVLDVREHAVLLSLEAPRRLRVFRLPADRWRDGGVVFLDVEGRDSIVLRAAPLRIKEVEGDGSIVVKATALSISLPEGHASIRFFQDRMLAVGASDMPFLEVLRYFTSRR